MLAHAYLAVVRKAAIGGTRGRRPGRGSAAADRARGAPAALAPALGAPLPIPRPCSTGHAGDDATSSAPAAATGGAEPAPVNLGCSTSRRQRPQGLPRPLPRPPGRPHRAAGRRAAGGRPAGRVPLGRAARRVDRAGRGRPVAADGGRRGRRDGAQGGGVPPRHPGARGPPHRPAEPPRARQHARARAGPGRAEPTSGSGSCCSTWTGSRRSTTGSATSPATSCWPRRRTGCAPASGAATRWPASAATSSRSWPRAPAPGASSSGWRAGSGRPWARPWTSPRAGPRCGSASASPCSRRTGTSAAELLGRADSALYAAKRDRSGHRFAAELARRTGRGPARSAAGRPPARGPHRCTPRSRRHPVTVRRRHCCRVGRATEWACPAPPSGHQRHGEVCFVRLSAMSRRVLLAAGAVLALAAAAAPGRAAPVTPESLLNAQKNPGEWLIYGRDYRELALQPARPRSRRTNVGQLQPVWAMSTGGKLGGLEATPLFRDGVLYFSRRLFAGVRGRRADRQHRCGATSRNTRRASTPCCAAARSTAAWRSRAICVYRRAPRCHAGGAQPRPTARSSGSSEDRRLEERRHHQLGAPLVVRRPRHHRRLGRRIRRARLPQVLQRQDRRARMDDLHDSGARRAGQRDLAEGRQLEDRRRADLAHRQLRCRDQHALLGHRQSRLLGRPTCIRATICGPTRCWRSIPTPARSNGASSTRRTTPGTMTAWRRRSWSTSRSTASRRKAAVVSPTATASSTCIDRTDGKFIYAMPTVEGINWTTRPRSRRPASRRSTRR